MQTVKKVLQGKEYVELFMEDSDSLRGWVLCGERTGRGVSSFTIDGLFDDGERASEGLFHFSFYPEKCILEVTSESTGFSQEASCTQEQFHQVILSAEEMRYAESLALFCGRMNVGSLEGAEFLNAMKEHFAFMSQLVSSGDVQGNILREVVEGKSLVISEQSLT